MPCLVPWISSLATNSSQARFSLFSLLTNYLSIHKALSYFAGCMLVIYGTLVLSSMEAVSCSHVEGEMPTVLNPSLDVDWLVLPQGRIKL